MWPPSEHASPPGKSPGQDKSPAAAWEVCGGGAVGATSLATSRVDVRRIRSVSLTPLWQVRAGVIHPATRGPGDPGMTPRNTTDPGGDTVVSPDDTGIPEGLSVASDNQCNDATQRVAIPKKCEETLDEIDIRGRPSSCQRLCVARGMIDVHPDMPALITCTEEELLVVDVDPATPSAVPAPSICAEEDQLVVRRGEGPPMTDAMGRDWQACHLTEDIPFIDEDDDYNKSSMEPEPVLLRTKRETDPAARLKRKGEHMLEYPAAATFPPAPGGCSTLPETKELVIYRRKRRESPDRAKRQAWYVGTGAVVIRGCRSVGEVDRPPSLDVEALHALLHQLMITKTAAEAADIMSVERRGTKALELWARRVTDGYQGVSISNMTTDWRNGLAFCALIHRFRPDLIEYSSLKPENIFENNALAFRVAEQQLGIPALLDAEDMVENDVPDRLSVLTYVSQYYQAFAAMGFTLPKQVANKSSPQSIPTENVKAKLTSPSQPKNKTERKTDKMLVGGRIRREVCAGCSNPVFLAERLLVGSPGQLMHRTCFRCARCNTQLTLASYYETEKGQFCCETCPDEERNDSPVVDSISISSNTSSKHKRQSSASDTESEFDSDTENSGEENDSYSHDAETLLEDKTHHTDTQSDTLLYSPKAIPKPPKPRTIFLSQTLEGTDVKDDLNEHTENSNASNRISNFAQVSPALFGSKDYNVRVKAISSSGQDSHDDAKGMKTDPPVTPTLDTGQDDRTTNISNGAIKTSSSIVAERLKMFREISDKSYKTDIKKTNTVFEKRKIEQNYVHLDKKENGVSDKIKRDIESIVEKPNTDEYTKDVYEYTKDVSDNAVIHEGEVESDSSVNEKEGEIVVNTVNKKATENIIETDQLLPAVPSITITPEVNEVGDLYEEVIKEESYSNDQHDAKTEIPEEPPSKNAMPQDFNPFEADESQQEECNMAVSQSEGSIEAGNNNAECIPMDSGASFSSTFRQSVQYPNDLNPFGSEGESETEDVMTDTTVKAEMSDTQVHDTKNTAKKLIKVNLNPFESDEDDDNDFEKEMEKEKEKKEGSKGLNPFWSDNDESPGDIAEITPSKKVKPPRPPPPTLARNSTPSQMYSRSSGNTHHSLNSWGDSISNKKIIAPSPPPSVRELFPQAASPTISPARTHPSPSLSTAKSHPSPSSPCGSLALKRKARRAPAPPQAVTPKSGRTSPTDSSADTLSMDTVSLCSIGAQNEVKHGQEEDQDEVLSWKMQKDMKNHSNKMNGLTDQHAPPPKPSRTFQTSKNVTCETGLPRRPSMSKSEAGEWQRKKGPAPPRPVPQKRAIKKLPMRVVQQELQDIEIKQTELERQGVLLETTIRNRTENASNNSEDDGTTTSSGPNSIEVEDMIMQLFELVNEKNELFRRQTELMYLKREKRLEEEYVELEYQIRCLMLKPPTEKTEVDTAQEEELIARLVKVVEQRDEIINCLELDRLREAQEDESIATHMMKYQEKHIDGVENGSSLHESPKRKKALKLPKKKKKKEKKDKKGAKADADKDIDETETLEMKKKKKKKKWLF